MCHEIRSFGNTQVSGGRRGANEEAKTSNQAVIDNLNQGLNAMAQALTGVNRSDPPMTRSPVAPLYGQPGYSAPAGYPMPSTTPMTPAMPPAPTVPAAPALPNAPPMPAAPSMGRC